MTTQDITRDALTRLLNRREFERHVVAALAAAQARSTRHALCYLDLDRFKAVNDVCGHDVGDRMLVDVAALIKDKVGDLGMVARVGGDEFCVLLTDCSLETAQEVADGIVRAIADYRFMWQDGIFQVGVSIGLVEVSRESGSLEDVIFAADMACFRSKKTGVHVYVYSSREAEATEARRRDALRKLQLSQDRGDSEKAPVARKLNSAQQAQDWGGNHVVRKGDALAVLSEESSGWPLVNYIAGALPVPVGPKWIFHQRDEWHRLCQEWLAAHPDTTDASAPHDPRRLIESIVRETPSTSIAEAHLQRDGWQARCCDWVSRQPAAVESSPEPPLGDRAQ